MRGQLAPLLARLLIGLALGAFLYVAVGPVYHRFLRAAGDLVLRITEPKAQMRLHQAGDQVVINRKDFPSPSFRPALSIQYLTYNVVLLSALFAIPRRPLADRNVYAFFKSLGILFLTHVLALVAQAHSILALNLGTWSDAHYGVVARNFWTAASHFYGLFGAFGIAIALWLYHFDPRRWNEDPTSDQRVSAKSKKKRKSRG